MNRYKKVVSLCLVSVSLLSVIFHALDHSFVPEDSMHTCPSAEDGLVSSSTLASQITSPFIVNLTSPTNYVRSSETALSDSSTAMFYVNFTGDHYNVALTRDKQETIWITVPKESNVISAQLNISGQAISGRTNWKRGYMRCSGYLLPSINAIDGNQSTYFGYSRWPWHGATETCWGRHYYIIPTNLSVNKLTFMYTRTGGGVSQADVMPSLYNFTGDSWCEVPQEPTGTHNRTINLLTEAQGCISDYGLVIFDAFVYGCLRFSGGPWEHTDYYEIGTNSSETDYNYESYPNNPYFDVCSDGNVEWSYAGVFNQSVIVDMNRTAINEYLSSSTPDDNGNVEIPITIHSDSGGVIRISDINVTYDYNTSYLYNITYDPERLEYDVKNTMNRSSITLSYLGFYIDDDTTGVYSCAIDEIIGYPIKTFNGHKYVEFEETVNQGSYWPNHRIRLDNVIVIPPKYGNDTWPMFRHDSRNTGYSLSESVTKLAGPLWKRRIDKGVTYGTEASPVIADGLVFVGTKWSEFDDYGVPGIFGGRLFALNVSTGHILWDKKTGPLKVPGVAVGYAEIRGTPAVNSGVVFFGAADGIVYALNETNGEPLWNFTQTHPIKSSPIVAEGIVFVGAQVYDISRVSWGRVFALNKTTGMKLWERTLGTAVWSTPAYYQGRVYVTTYTAEAQSPAPPGIVTGVYALNATNGDILWSHEGQESPPAGTGYYASPAVAEDIVIVANNEMVQAFNATSGDSIWNVTGGTKSSPAMVDGVVYIDCRAINTSTGNIVWDANIGGIKGSPVVAGKTVFISGYKRACAGWSGDAYVYASGDGYIYALDRHTGRVKGYFESEEAFSSPSIAYGKLFIASKYREGYWQAGADMEYVEYGSVYCFGSTDYVKIVSSGGDSYNITITTAQPTNLPTLTQFDFNESLHQLIFGDSQSSDRLCAERSYLVSVPKGLFGGSFQVHIDGALVPSLALSNQDNYIIYLMIPHLQSSLVRIVAEYGPSLPAPSIAEFFSSDQYGNSKSTFTAGAMASFKITVDNTVAGLDEILVTVNVYDSNNTVIGVASFRGSIRLGSSAFILGAPIPLTAHLGNATAYVNIFSDWPSQGGVPLCPESSATFQITDGT